MNLKIAHADIKKYFIPFLIIFLFLVLFPSMTFSFDGPLQVKNQFPLFIHIASPYLETASTEDAFSVNLSYSSVYMMRSSARWSVRLDMELAEINFRYRKRIGDLFELGIDVPFLSFNSGGMDGFLESYHETFGLPDYDRSERPENEFLYEVRRDGVLVIKGESGQIDIGDIRLTAKKEILKTDPVISIRIELELPTGNASEGYGSGSIDAGAAVLIDKKLSEVFNAFSNVGVVFSGDLRAHETVELNDFIYIGAGIEAAFWKNLSLIGQLYFQGSPYPETDISTIDRTAALLTLGGRYYLSNSSLEFSFTEDPNTSGAPDFTLGVLYKQRF